MAVSSRDAEPDRQDGRPVDPPARVTEASPEHLLEELRVHQAELQVQNEQLMESQEEAESARRRYVDLFNFAPIGYLSLDRDCVCHEANVCAGELLGVARRHLIDRPITPYIVPEQHGKLQHVVRQVIEEGQGASQEFLLRCRDSDPRPVRLELSRLDQRAKDPQVLVALVDLTELKQAQQAMIRSEKLAAAGILAGGVAHEFNNIHTAVLGYLELILRGEGLPEKVKSRLQSVQKAMFRASAVTDNLLSFARQGRPQKRCASLNDVVDGTIKIVDHQFRSQGIEVKVQLGEVPPIILDAGQIGQVLMNLCINAQHAMIESETKTLTIRTETRGDQAALIVSDTGCGIPEDLRRRIFRPFFTTKGENAPVDSEQHNLPGTGLGLGICESIIKGHGGRIVLDSQVNQGTIFTVLLPLETEDAAEAGQPAPQATEAPTRSLRILALDDEPMLRELLGDMLVSLGHEAMVSDDPAWGLDQIRAGACDLLMIDLQMPALSGIHCLEILNREGYLPELPVLVMTGKFDGPTLERLKSYPIRSLIRKPFDWTTVRREIAAAVRNS